MKDTKQKVSLEAVLSDIILKSISKILRNQTLARIAEAAMSTLKITDSQHLKSPKRIKSIYRYQMLLDLDLKDHLSFRFQLNL